VRASAARTDGPLESVRTGRGVGDVVTRGAPLFEIHAQSAAQLEFARDYAAARANIVRYGF